MREVERELNLAVAAAAFNTYFDRRRVNDCPHYSTDLNAAFAAAEKVGLWKQGYDLHMWSGLHNVMVWSVGDFHDDPLAEAETPALAICAAILKLAKETT